MKIASETMERKLKKFMKLLGKERFEEIEAMGEKELRDQIVRSNNNILNTRRSMDENEGYQEAVDKLKLVKGPYDDAMKYQKAIIELSVMVLQDKGKLSDESEEPEEEDAGAEEFE